MEVSHSKTPLPLFKAGEANLVDRTLIRTDLKQCHEQGFLRAKQCYPAARQVHGHSNADQYLTGASIGAEGAYQNSISLDQEYAEHAGDFTRHSSRVAQNLCRSAGN
jgi:hypothetical protein